MDATDAGGCHVDLIDAFAREEVAHGLLVAEVEAGMRAGDALHIALGLQGAHDGRSDHAPVAGDETRSERLLMMIVGAEACHAYQCVAPRGA